MKSLRILLVVALLVTFTNLAVGQVMRSKVPVLKSPTLKVPIRIATPLQFSQQFENVLKEEGVPQAKQTAAVARFRQLPSGLQKDLLSAVSDKWATKANMPVRLLPKYTIAPKYVIKPKFIFFLISDIWPDKGTPGCYAYVFGMPFNDNCKVVFDGTQLTTYYLGFGVEFFPNSLAFEIPSNATIGTNHQVKIRNISTNRETAAVDYRIIAPRGYRGYWGWQFHNFSAAVIPWHLYRDFFGANAVEYSNGTHRPSAQAWYDSTYKGVGGGGNCYGMTVSSLRARTFNITTYHQSWFAANHQPYTWNYPWQTQTKETAQEDQGGQLSAEMAYYITHYYHNQSHLQAWQRANNLTNNFSDYANLCFWGSGWGHSVVGYGTYIEGTRRYIQMYDNNAPYTETETGGPHKSLSYVDSTNGSYHYPGTSAYKMICLSYSECIQTPHLPASATGSAMNTTVATVNGGNVTQIQDQNGRTLFNADGTENTNPATRIPDAIKFIPFTGTTPANYPDTFIFNNSNGKNLTFTIAGTGSKTFRMFMAGDVFRANFNGQGQVIMNKILTNTRSLEIPAPGALKPISIRCIKVMAADRVFDVTNFRNLGNQKLLILPAANGSSLNVETGSAAQFNLQLQTFAGGANKLIMFPNISTQANSRATLQPSSWTNLPASQLNLQLRNLQNNQIIRNLRITPGK